MIRFRFVSLSPRRTKSIHTYRYTLNSDDSSQHMHSYALFFSRIISYLPFPLLFPSFILSYLTQGRPSNPMINSGAMVMTSLISPHSEPSRRFDLILKTWKQLAGNTVWNSSVMALACWWMYGVHVWICGCFVLDEWMVLCKDLLLLASPHFHT